MCIVISNYHLQRVTNEDCAFAIRSNASDLSLNAASDGPLACQSASSDSFQTLIDSAEYPHHRAQPFSSVTLHNYPDSRVAPRYYLQKQWVLPRFSLDDFFVIYLRQNCRKRKRDSTFEEMRALCERRAVIIVNKPGFYFYRN